MPESNRTPEAGTLLVADSVAHPDDAVLAAMAENRLRGAERDRLLRHLDSCPRCREVLVALEGDGPIPSDQVRTVTRDPLLGQRLGEYVVLELLAQGGMGRVYKGERVSDHKPVAIKLMLPDSASDADLARRVDIEARAVSAIHHPNIVEVFGSGALEDGRPWLVMELLDGFSLHERLQQKRRLTPREVATVLDQVMQALAAAHAEQLVHRDLKPGNLFVRLGADGKWQLKVLDFGLAKQLDRSAKTAANVVLGTPVYMAPEQVRGQGVGDRTDVYAMGVVAWELLTGKVPFDGETAAEVMRLHLDALLPPFPPGLGVPPTLEALLVKMLNKRPTDRPSAQAVAREAQALCRFFETAPAVEQTELADRPGWQSDVTTLPANAEVPVLRLRGGVLPPPPRPEPSTDRSLTPQAPADVKTMTQSPEAAPTYRGPPVSSMTIRDPAPVELRSRRKILAAIAALAGLAAAMTLTVVVVVARSPSSKSAEPGSILVAPPPPPPPPPQQAPAAAPVQLERADVEAELSAKERDATKAVRAKVAELRRRLAAGASPADVHQALEKLK